MPTITPFLTYDHQAEQAVQHYLSIFDGRIVSTFRVGDGGPGQKGSVLGITFELLGQTFQALNGGPSFRFSEAFSMFVACDTQEEIDRY
jgi:predicted 3-demethylubiquinone-9 3-methyltransferase (glyoxalase superfamily)